MEKRTIEVSWPLPFFFICLVAVAVLWAYPSWVPSVKDSQNWVNFHFKLICAIYFITAPTLIFKWPFHPGCNLSYHSGYGYSISGKMISAEEPCGRPAIGKIKAIKGKQEPVTSRYFCRKCDPDGQFFKQIIQHRYEQVFVNSVVRFWLIEKEIEASES